MNKVYWGIIIVLVAVIVFLRECSPGKCPAVPVSLVKSDTVLIKVTDTIRETVLVPVTKIVNHQPVPVTVVDSVFLTEIQHVDTVKILADYFATRNYSDTNHLEGYGNFIINDAITQNKIKNREIIYNLKFPQITNTVAIKPKNQVYIGLDVGGTDTWISFGPQFTLKTASDKMYHIGASYTSENKFYFHVGSDWLIHL